MKKRAVARKRKPITVSPENPTAGDYGTATAGYSGTATAGYKGCIQLSLLDDKAQRRRVKTAYVGEDGIKPGVAYRLNALGQFEEVKK